MYYRYEWQPLEKSSEDEEWNGIFSLLDLSEQQAARRFLKDLKWYSDHPNFESESWFTQYGYDKYHGEMETILKPYRNCYDIRVRTAETLDNIAVRGKVQVVCAIKEYMEHYMANLSIFAKTEPAGICPVPVESFSISVNSVVTDLLLQDQDAEIMDGTLCSDVYAKTIDGNGKEFVLNLSPNDNVKIVGAKLLPGHPEHGKITFEDIFLSSARASTERAYFHLTEKPYVLEW